MRGERRIKIKISKEYTVLANSVSLFRTFAIPKSPSLMILLLVRKMFCVFCNDKLKQDQQDEIEIE